MNNRGSSLMQVIVASGIMAIIMFAMVSFMGTQQKEAAALAESIGRTELQRFLSGALADGSVCKAELTTPELWTSGATARKINETNLLANNFSLQKIHGAASATAPVLVEVNSAAGIVAPNLKVSSIEFKNFVSAGVADKFYADLEVSFDRNSMVRAIKPVVIKTTFTTDPTSPAAAKVITTCGTTGSIDLKQTCIGLGGQWLEATNPSRFMPAPRCNLTDDIFLNTSENPDNIPDKGRANADGAAVTECYYGAAKISTYKCVARTGSFTADVCAYDLSAKQWKVTKYAAGAPTSTDVRVCNRGVYVSKKSSGFEILNWNEPLEKVYPTLVGASWYKNSDYLQSITQCRFHSRAESWMPCKNPTSPEIARAGLGGSCLYIKNGKLNIPSDSKYQNYFTWYNADNDPDMVKSNYTGWIYVNSARTVTLKANQIIVKEARGIPCYSVEVNTANEPAESVASVNNPMSLLSGGADPTRIKACRIAANTTASADNIGTLYNTVLTCVQDLTAPMPIVDTDINDQYPAKSCWYFKDMYIKTYSPLLAKSNWLYVQGALPNAGIKIDESDYSITHSGAVSKTVTGTPCVDGVEYE